MLKILDEDDEATATATATATASYNYMAANTYSPEEICHYSDIAVRHLPCSNTVVATEENIWNRIPVQSHTELTRYQSDVWQWNTENQQQANIIWVGIPIQVLGGSVTIQVEVRCTSIENYKEPRLGWDVYTADPYIIEYSESSAYENVWVKFGHPILLHSNDVCRVFFRLTKVDNDAMVHLQLDRLGSSFTFGLVA